MPIHEASNRGVAQENSGQKVPCALVVCFNRMHCAASHSALLWHVEAGFAELIEKRVFFLGGGARNGIARRSVHFTGAQDRAILLFALAHKIIFPLSWRRTLGHCGEAFAAMIAMKLWPALLNDDIGVLLSAGIEVAKKAGFSILERGRPLVPHLQEPM